MAQVTCLPVLVNVTKAIKCYRFLHCFLLALIIFFKAMLLSSRLYNLPIMLKIVTSIGHLIYVIH